MLSGNIRVLQLPEAGLGLSLISVDEFIDVLIIITILIYQAANIGNKVFAPEQQRD